jgi:hypothetical protein
MQPRGALASINGRKERKMEYAVIVVALIGFVAFRQYLAHHRRIMVHRERMAALEKGIELPPLEQEVRRSNVNIQRVLLISGLIWISLGLTTYSVLTTMLVQSSLKFRDEIPNGMQYIAIGPFGIGIAHLVALFVGRKRAS